MSNSETLVTGGAGFIGAHLVSFLLGQGKKVVVVDDLSTGTYRNFSRLNVDVELLVGDVADQMVLERLAGRSIGTIYHLASQADVPLSVRQPLRDFNTNMRGTLNILEFAREQKAQVVFPSTVSVYARDCQKPIPETAPIHASSPYGASKAGGENYCYAYTTCYGVRTVVARLFNVYGPLMSKYVIYDFVRKLHTDPKTLTIIGSGNQKRDYTYVDDAVRALVLLSEDGVAGLAYNLGSGVPTRIIDLAKMIAAEMGLGQVQLQCTQQEAIGDIQEWFADISRLRGLGYNPTVSFSDGLRQTVQSLLDSL